MNWDQIGNWFVMFLSGCGVALEIFAVTLVCAIPLGVLLSFGRRSKYKVISWPVSLYISIMRGTPLLLQLLFVYFAPKYMFGLNYDRFLAALIAFVLNYAAYFAEIFRGGMDSMEKGQYEASAALGLSKSQTFFRIILVRLFSAPEAGENASAWPSGAGRVIQRGPPCQRGQCTGARSRSRGHHLRCKAAAFW